MPIYAYRCDSCGHSKDVLQKLSDAPLTTCPACHAESFSKQITAAGFQLKGSGWYQTDFRGGTPSSAAKPTTDSVPAAAPCGNAGSCPAAPAAAAGASATPSA